MFQDRSYQIEGVQSIWTYFGSNTGNPIVAMPTGTGKSVVIARFLQQIYKYYPTQRIMILTHVKELIAQNYSKLIQMWPFAPAGIYSSGLNRKDLSSPITFAGIASVVKRPDIWGHIDLVLVDECHLISPNDNTMYRKFIGELAKRNPKIKVIGFTATAWRLGHGKLTDPTQGPEGEIPSLFSDICFDITGIEPFNRLIAEGFLAPLIPKRTNTILDVDGVHMRGGEFVQSELQVMVDREEITEHAVREAMEMGHDRLSWLCFAAGVEHAIHTAEIMNRLGVSAIAIHSKMGDTERDKAIRDFKAGKYRCAVNNNVLTTGFDHPPIDLILVLRPTASSVLWVQMLGRGTRPYDPRKPGDVDASVFWRIKENCMVLDYAQNTKRLGPINDPVIPRKKGKGTGEAPVKECPICEGIVHASLRFCDGVKLDGTKCDHEFKFDHKLKTNSSDSELIKGELPVVEVFDVTLISFTKHQKMANPPTIQVSYMCGLREFREWVCPEHTNYAGKKARDWWRERSDEPMPTSCDEFLDKAQSIKVATQIRVWTNQKYPTILAACFDGTSFGTKIDDGSVNPEIIVPRPKSKDSEEQKASFIDDMDDDIPF